MLKPFLKFLTVFAAIVAIGGSGAMAQDSVSGSAGAAVSKPSLNRKNADAEQKLTLVKLPICSCIKCGSTSDNFKKLDPVFCGSPGAAAEFMSRVDKDKKTDGFVCEESSGDNDACPVLAPMPKFKQSSCTAKSDAKCTLMESSDNNGVTCRFECCGPNGCVAPDWMQVITYTPYNALPLSTIKEADRDQYFSLRAKAAADIASDANDAPYRGPQALCTRVPNVTALNSNTCLGKGGRVDIVYGTRGVQLTHRNGVTAAVMTDIAYKDLTDEDISAIPYEYRDAFRAAH